MRTYIGVDMGTSGLKLVMIDESRNILAQSSREYETSHPHEGWSEMNPEVWYEAMMACLHDILEGQDPQLVESIGVTGQMHTLILLDGDGRCVRPAIMWNDKRTAGMIPELRTLVAAYPEGQYMSGIISTGSPAAALCWLKREEPDAFSRVRKFLIGPDYLAYRLTGYAGTDYVDASTSGLYCLKAHAWSREFREYLGLDECAYPEVRGSCMTAGRISAGIAQELGLRDSVRVITGTGDNAAAAVSTGCIAGGYPVISLGTSGVLMFPVSDIDGASRGKALLFSTDGESFSYLLQGAVQSTGTSINWWLRKVLNMDSYGSLDDMVNADMILGSDVMFYPHINGDKTIYADPELKGAFTGLTSRTSSHEMYYAVLEGLCFAFRQLSEYMQMPKCDSLKVVGGGAKSDLWLRTLASVMNIRVERLGGAASPSYGAALLACPSGYAKAAPEVAQVFTPDEGMTAHYDAKYSRYLKIHDAMKYIYSPSH